MTKTRRPSAAHIARRVAQHPDAPLSPYERWLADSAPPDPAVAPMVTVAGRARVLAAEADGAGAFRALVSQYDLKYRIGFFLHHTIEMGAFAADLEANAVKPTFWMHGWSYFDGTYSAPIGTATHEENEDEGGLVADGQLYVVHGEVARVHQSMLDGAINEWSIGYRPLTVRVDADDPDHEYVIEAELIESSVVVRGANPGTGTLDVAGLRGRRATTEDLDDQSSLSAAEVEQLRALLADDTPPPEPPATNDLSTLPWSAQKRIREIYGS